MNVERGMTRRIAGRGRGGFTDQEQAAAEAAVLAFADQITEEMAKPHYQADEELDQSPEQVEIEWDYAACTVAALLAVVQEQDKRMKDCILHFYM